MRKIKVIVKRPGQIPYMAWVSDRLENLQAIVGGPIEVYPLRGNLAVVCNEEGLLLGLPVNCYFDHIFWVGTIFFVSLNGSEFDDCPTYACMKSLLPTLWDL